MPSTKHALVTGALGHTGSFMVKLLVENGWNVVATDLPPEKRKKLLTKEKVFINVNLPSTIDGKNVEFVSSDLNSKNSLISLFNGRKYDAIFSIASLYDYFAKLDLLIKINVGGLRNLLEAYHKSCLRDYESPDEYPRFIHWSTCGVYGQPRYKDWQVPADESAPYDPPNDYSKSKALQEIILKKWRERWNLPITIIRPGPIYGPGQLYGAYHVFRAFNNVISIPIVKIIPKKRRLRMPMVHVEDLVRAALFLAKLPRENVVGEAFNVLDDCGFQDDFTIVMGNIFNLPMTHMKTHWFLYKIIARMLYRLYFSTMWIYRRFGKRPKIDAPMADYIVHQYHFSNEKIKKLGFKFKYPDQWKGTRETVNWYIKNGWMEKESPLSLFL
ncbi:MAG: NAD-dependent epimerase/dehydratase family protein [Candidatus Hodarchaeota archaeon]